jgi:hypothetical protein
VRNGPPAPSTGSSRYISARLTWGAKGPRDTLSSRCRPVDCQIGLPRSPLSRTRYHLEY